MTHRNPETSRAAPFMTDATALRVAVWALRVTLAAAFLSAVADRFGLWGAPGAANVAWGAWQPFVDYTGTLLGFLPNVMVVPAGIVATVAEIMLGIWLLTGWKSRLAAFASLALLLSFALAMVVSLGVKAPLDYSVFTATAAAFALGVLARIPAK